MTIFDVALHKWQMLDDRRRRIILGFTLIIIAIVVGLIFLARWIINHGAEDGGSSNSHDTHPKLGSDFVNQQ